MTLQPWEIERIQRLWHPSAHCLIVPLIANSAEGDEPWCIAFVPVDEDFVGLMEGLAGLGYPAKQSGWVSKQLEGVYLLHADGRWEACGWERWLCVDCLDAGTLMFSIYGDIAGFGTGSPAGCSYVLVEDLRHWLTLDEDAEADAEAKADADAGEPPSGRPWWLVHMAQETDDDERPTWYSTLMPGAMWPFLEAWRLPDPVGSLRPSVGDEHLDPEHVALGISNLRANHSAARPVFEPGQWPLPLPEYLTRPGPRGWAHFPHATATFFHPLGEALAPVGERPEPLAEAPTLDMPAEVRLRADAIEVCFGALPTLLRGKPFRVLQYELEGGSAFEPASLRATLSLGLCNQVLEGRFEEQAPLDPQPVQGMWFIRLGPRDDTVIAAIGDSLPGRMRKWYDGL